MSYRELWVFLKHLPIDSWTQTALRDRDDLEELRAPDVDAERQFGPWSLTNYQLASLVDEMAWTRFLIARTNRLEKYPEPQPVPRPGRKAKAAIAPKQSEAAVIYLSKLRATGG